uniref:hypothetical protein n=1 Tax=Trichocoleus desertorum TaxID=1481672 RepID=UPI0025B414C0|nr:hypothetical protein [Trichocoleus desertorum]
MNSADDRQNSSHMSDQSALNTKQTDSGIDADLDDLQITDDNVVYNERLLNSPAVMPEMPGQQRDADAERKEKI